MIFSVENKTSGLVLIFAQKQHLLSPPKIIVYFISSLCQLVPGYHCPVSSKPWEPNFCILPGFMEGKVHFVPLRWEWTWHWAYVLSGNPESCILQCKLTLEQISQNFHHLLGEPTPQFFPAAACSHGALPEKLNLLARSSSHCPSFSCLQFLPRKGWICNLLGSLFQQYQQYQSLLDKTKAVFPGLVLSLFPIGCCLQGEGVVSPQGFGCCVVFPFSLSTTWSKKVLLCHTDLSSGPYSLLLWLPALEVGLLHHLVFFVPRVTKGLRNCVLNEKSD